MGRVPYLPLLRACSERGGHQEVRRGAGNLKPFRAPYHVQSAHYKPGALLCEA